MIKLWVDNEYSIFNFLNKDKYNVISKKNNFYIDFEKSIGDVFVKTNRNSWFSCCDNLIDMTIEHDLDMLKNIYAANINIPRFIYSWDKLKYFKYLEYDKKYLLKSFNSARTIGQMFVTKENIFEIINDSNIMSHKEFNDKYKIDLSTCETNEEEKLLKDNIKDSQFYISDIQKFNGEYRILYFENLDFYDFIIEEREGYQINSKEKRSHRVIEMNSNSIINRMNILETLKEFGDSHYSPCLSFDVWIDEDNFKWGLFEYSTEFGTIYTNNNRILEKQINDVFDYRCEKLLTKI